MPYNTATLTRSLYIHWPFCPYKCHFCPFVALAGHDQFMVRYHQALSEEIKSFAGASSQDCSIETIYLGGGTPSTYPPHLLLDMFDTLRNVFFIKTDAEISMEVNPGTVKQEYFALWKQAGINRLSIGVQTLNDSVLKSLNRLQSNDDVTWLLGKAKDVFENISIDLILGLPGVSQQEWKQMLAQVVFWPITHLSLYFLTVHENTPLYFKVKQKKVSLPPDDALVDLYHWTVDFLSQHGFERYELSSFSRRGFQARHNTVYWDRKPFKGFGIGACSFDGQQRLQNEKNLMKYFMKIESGQDPEIFSEHLTPEQIHLERLMLGLRRSVGVAFDLLVSGLSHDKKVIIKQRIAALEEHGFLIEKDGVLRLTPRGLMVENEVVTQLSW